MRYTLLEIVQLILSSMDSDEVNDINDTVESTQVATLLKSVFYDCAVDLGLPEHEALFELNASGDNAKPTLMTVPSNVTKINWIKYNNKLTTETYSNYLPLTYIHFDQFLDEQQSLREMTSDVGSMTFSSNGESFEVLYASDKMPEKYTTFNDRTILFDSYLATEDTTLQKSKTMCSGVLYPTFTLSNTFTPDLDPTQFSYFINRAKVRAFAELKQSANQEAASETRRQKIVVQKRKRTTPNRPELERRPHYGRK